MCDTSKRSAARSRTPVTRYASWPSPGARDWPPVRATLQNANRPPGRRTGYAIPIAPVRQRPAVRRSEGSSVRPAPQPLTVAAGAVMLGRWLAWVLT